jgi:SAM-dependent methyltransferase
MTDDPSIVSASIVSVSTARAACVALAGWIALGAGACGHAPAAAPTSPQAALQAAATAAPPASLAAIAAQSHALIEAYDRGDAPALDAALAPGFVKFENEHLTDRAGLLQGAGNKPHPPDTTRIWNDEHVYLRDHDAVFIGMASEHETGNASHGNRAYDGWYTISWTVDHGAWKAAHWSWQPHRTSIENARDMWNGTYRQSVGFDHRPNHLLVDTVRGVAPGAALDVMMGQGRNAIYLAAQGWHVTGIDIADEGLRIARDAAAAQHLDLAAVQADAEAYDYGVARWDLVAMIYAGDSTQMIEKIKPSLRPGGRFVLEYFARRPDQPRGGFAEGQLAKLFGDGFEIVRDEVVDDTPDWAQDRAKLVRFVARKR